MSIRAYAAGLIVIAVLSFGTVSCDRSKVSAANENGNLTAQKVLSMDDRTFLVGAEKSAIWQKALAEHALANSKRAAVVEFARTVIQNCDSSLPELTNLMKAKQVTEPAPFAGDLRLDAANRLDPLSGNDLNDEFISLITAEQQQQLRRFNSAAETAADPDIRNYARATLPSLERNLDQSTAVEKKLTATTR